MGLLTIALARLNHQRVLAGALALGLLAAVGLAGSVPLLQAEAQEVALHSTLSSLGERRFITVEQFSIHDVAAFEAFQSDAATRVTQSLGPVALSGAQFSRLGPVRFSTVNGKAMVYEGGEPQPTLAYYRDLARHVDVKAGALPPDLPTGAGADVPVSLSVQGAQLLYLDVGDRACLPILDRSFAANRGLPNREVCLHVAATWQARNPADTYWAGAPPGLFLMFSRDDFFALTRMTPSGTLNTGHYFAADLSQIDAGNAPGLVDRMNGLRGYFQVRREGLFTTGLDSSLKTLQDRERGAAFTIQLVAAALVLIALYSVAFAGTYFLEGQAAGAALLRSRGWSRPRTWRLLMVPQAVLAIFAVPAGLGLAWLIVSLAARAVYGSTAQPLRADDLRSAAPAVALAVMAELLVLAVLSAAASRGDVLQVRRAASRPPRTPWYRRGGLDLILCLAAIPLLLESRLRGSGRLRDVTASDDPLSLLLPSLALAFLALGSLRLLPLMSALAGRLDRGIAGALAASQVTRRSGQHARLALLLTFTVAIGVFTSVYASTEQHNTLDRADYQAGADVRATYQLAQQPPPLADTLGSLNGVTGSSQALRTTANPGRANLQASLLGVEPAALPAVAWSRVGLNPTSLDQELGLLASNDPDGLQLPGRPSTISVWVFSSGLDTRLAAALTDAQGHKLNIVLGDLTYSGYQQLSAPVNFGRSGPAYPLKLRQLAVLRHAGGRDAGELALSDLAVDGERVEGFDATRGWWRATVAPQAEVGELTASTHHARDGRPATDVAADTRPGDLLLRPKLSDRPLPVLVAQPTLQKLGIGLGEAFPLHLDIQGTTASAVGSLDHFPTLYPGEEDFMVAPLDSLVARITRDGGQIWPNELWLKVTQSHQQVADRLQNSPGILEVVDRANLEEQALANPLRKALGSTLVLGFFAALVAAVVGFGLHFLAAVRTRLDEYAILQANGLSAGLVRRSLANEERLVLAQSLLAGAVLGLLMAFAVLPAVQLGSAPADVIPPTVVTPGWPALAAALAVVLAGSLLAGWLVGRSIGRVRPLDRLRELG